MRFSGANVSKAMKSCNPEGGKLPHHNKVEEIREFPNVGDCNVSGMVEKLKFRGEFGATVVIRAKALKDVSGTIGPVKVFTTEGNLFSTSTGDCRRSEDPDDGIPFCCRCSRRWRVRDQHA